MSPNRIVALITPACALAAGWAASWLADNVPGLNISQENLQAVFIAGAVAVILPALQWLHGWQKWEERSDAQTLALQQGLPAIAAPLAPADDGGAVETATADFADDVEDDDYEDLVDFDDFEDTSVDEEEPVTTG